MHVVIIGAYGSAGAAAADRLAGEPDVELTLIDDGDPGGGLCILKGCMPSKEVLSAAAHRYQARHDDRVGEPPGVDLDRVVDRKDEHVSSFAAHRRSAIHDLAKRDDVRFIHDTARFVGPHTVAVDGETIEGDYVVLATGSSVSLPDLPGMDEVDPLTSAEVLDARSLPDSGVVMGFGYVGLELVPYIAEAGGTDLTVIEHDRRPIDEADSAFGDALLDIYREHFDVEILTRTREKAIQPTTDEFGDPNDGVKLTVERNGKTEAITADRLFAFTGRQPSLPDGITETHLEPGRGWVADTMQAVDDERTFVVGDVNGKEPILHVAKEQALTAAENILRHDAGEPLEPYRNVHHHVIFSGLGVYPFARVGHSDASAAEAGLDHHTVTRRASDDGVFKTKDVPEGLASLTVADDGTVLGYQGLHYHADVMAKTMQVIVEGEMDVRDLPDRAYHPTTPEILDGLFRDATAEL
jgi:pyruvate/2-oxoglutarate dehydrogenase complex dihydrolipoamide dehydrogenase (E3) component